MMYPMCMYIEVLQSRVKVKQQDLDLSISIFDTNLVNHTKLHTKLQCPPPVCRNQEIIKPETVRKGKALKLYNPSSTVYPSHPPSLSHPTLPRLDTHSLVLSSPLLLPLVYYPPPPPSPPPMTFRGCNRRVHQCNSVKTIRRNNTPANVIPMIIPVAMDWEGSFIGIWRLF